MPDTLVIRIVALGAVAALTWLVVVAVRGYASLRRRQTLAAAPAPEMASTSGDAGVRVLAFSSEDCGPCHTLQRPALERLLGERSGQVSVVEIDAPTAPDLTRRYAVLTVPTTVVLDATGKARAVNYGFAPTAKLLAQVDAALGAQAIPA
ncbi:MAG: thioredoxin family protein [Chloroflexota bacterium]|nr:thioredoxin family protein [Chloroflexota bacterium]